MTDPQISIKIAANSDGVAAALDHATEHIQRAQQAAELAADVLGVKVPAALQEILAESALVGPALEAALPELDAVNFIELMGDLAGKARDLYDKYFTLKDATSEWRDITDELDASSRSALQGLQRSYVQFVRITRGEAAALRAEMAGSGIDTISAFDSVVKIVSDTTGKKMKDVSDGLKADLNQLRDFPAYELQDKIDLITAALNRSVENIHKVMQESGVNSRATQIAEGEFHILERVDTLLRNIQAERNQMAQTRGAELKAFDAKQLDDYKEKFDALITRVLGHVGQLTKKVAADQQDLIVRTNLQALQAYEQQNYVEIKANEQKLQTENQDAAAYYEGQIAVARNAEKQTEGLLQLESKQHKITRNEEAKASDEAKLLELATEERYLKELEGLYDKGSRDWERVQTRITNALQQQAAVRAKIAAGEEQTFKTQLRKQLLEWQQVNLQLGHTFTSTLQSMNSSLAGFIVTGQDNFRQLVTSAIEQFVQMGLQYSESLLLMKLFGESARQSQTDDVLTGAIAQINAQAQIAGANVYAEWAWNPPVALAMSADAIATVGAMAAAAGAGIGKFELGGVVPMTGLALLHKGEKVIPANMSGTGQGIATDGLHVHFHVHAVDGQDGANFINRQMGNITNNLVKHLKKRGFFSQ